MIDAALKFLTAELNAYLLVRTGSPLFGRAEVGRIVEDTGKWAIPVDQFAVSLINVSEERTMRSQLPETVLVNGQHIVVEPELKLNLTVMFAGNFQKYDQALRQLSYVLTFFQSHPLFIGDEHPNLDPRIMRISVELQSLSYDQLNQVWAFVGGKQLPSAIYLVRTVALQDGEPSAIQPPIASIATSVRGR